MDYTTIENKLKTDLSVNELEDIASFLLTDPTTTSVGLNAHRNYINHVLSKYNGSSTKLNDTMDQIIKKKNFTNFFQEQIIQCDHLNKATCFNRHSWFLKIWFDSVKKAKLSTNESCVNHLFLNVDNGSSFYDLMMKFSGEKFTISSSTVVQSIIKYGSHIFFRYLISNDIIINVNEKAKIQNMIDSSSLISNNNLKSYLSDDNDNYKYTNDDISLLLVDKNHHQILLILEFDHLDDNFTLSLQLFYFLMIHQKYNTIIKFINGPKISNIKACAKLFFSDAGIKNINVIAADDHNSLHDTYKYFVKNKYAVADKSHLDLFFKLGISKAITFLIEKKGFIPSKDNFSDYINSSIDRNLFEKWFNKYTFTSDELDIAFSTKDEIIITFLIEKRNLVPSSDNFNILLKNDNNVNCDMLDKWFNKHTFGSNNLDYAFDVKKSNIISFLIQKQKIQPSNDNFTTFITSKMDNNLFNEWFDQFSFTENNLEFACINHNKIVIAAIFNNRVTPTNKCYEAIFINTHKIKPDEVVCILNMFISAGYQLTNNNVLYAINKGFLLDIDVDIDDFVPTEQFYNLCSESTMPKYNNKMYKDILWVRRLCRLARVAADFAKIKKFVSENKIQLDMTCKSILQQKKYSKSKIKTELIIMCKDTTQLAQDSDDSDNDDSSDSDDCSDSDDSDDSVCSKKRSCVSQKI
jgi:hypothetical protein